MEKNYSSRDQGAVFDPALSLPHFDEETTLLSARPVVPLHEVKAEARSRRGLIFGLTILAAILLGATSATLMMMQSGQNPQSASEAGMSQLAVSASGAANGFTSGPDEARVSASREEDKEAQSIEVPNAHESSKKLPKAASSRKASKADSADYETDEYFENDERESRRAERRDSRREMKRLRRKGEQVGDDLLRIREIFEGSPRP